MALPASGERWENASKNTNVMIIWGSKGVDKIQPGGNFFCPSCKSDTTYTRIRVARYFTLYFIPLFETRTLGDYVRCGRCAANLPVEVLSFSRAELLEAIQPWVCESCGNQNAVVERACLRCHQPRPAAPPPLPSSPERESAALPPPVPAGRSASSVAAPRSAKSSDNKALWIFPAIVGALLLYGVVVRVTGWGKNMHFTTPGKVELHEAERAVSTDSHGVAQGNFYGAELLASKLSGTLLQDRKEVISGNDSQNVMTKGSFVVFCQLNPESCAFLVHVPNLNQYTPAAAELIADTAYVEAYRILDAANKPGIRKLAVATRGNLLYGTLRTGGYRPGADRPFDTVKKLGGESTIEEALLPYFAAPPETAAATPPTATASPAPAKQAIE